MRMCDLRLDKLASLLCAYIGRQVGDQYKEQRELTKMIRVAFGFQRMIGKQELYVGCTPPFAG